MKFSSTMLKSLAWGGIGLAILIGLALYLMSDYANVKEAKQFAAGLGFLLLLLGSFFYLIDKNALRSSGEGDDRPYSFSRVQMWLWTFIILGSYLGVFAATGNYWSMNSTCLALLGISSLTTAGSRMIDGNKEADAIAKHQEPKQLRKSRGIMYDILSDDKGLSMHRFQAMVFNIAYGLSFVVEVFSDLTKTSFPVYDATVLTLLGLSSGTYLVMKTSEKGKVNIPVNAAVGATPNAAPVSPVTNDELPDLDNSNTPPPQDN